MSLATALATLKGAWEWLTKLLPAFLGLLLGRKQVQASNLKEDLKAKEVENAILKKQRDNDVHSSADALRVHRDHRADNDQ